MSDAQEAAKARIAALRGQIEAEKTAIVQAEEAATEDHDLALLEQEEANLQAELAALRGEPTAQQRALDEGHFVVPMGTVLTNGEVLEPGIVQEGDPIPATLDPDTFKPVGQEEEPAPTGAPADPEHEAEPVVVSSVPVPESVVQTEPVVTDDTPADFTALPTRPPVE